MDLVALNLPFPLSNPSSLWFANELAFWTSYSRWLSSRSPEGCVQPILASREIGAADHGWVVDHILTITSVLLDLCMLNSSNVTNIHTFPICSMNLILTLIFITYRLWACPLSCEMISCPAYVYRFVSAPCANLPRFWKSWSYRRQQSMGSYFELLQVWHHSFCPWVEQPWHHTFHIEASSCTNFVIFLKYDCTVVIVYESVFVTTNFIFPAVPWLEFARQMILG